MWKWVRTAALTTEFRNCEIAERPSKGITFTKTFNHLLNVRHIRIADIESGRSRYLRHGFVIVCQRTEKNVIHKLFHLETLNILHLFSCNTFSANSTRNIYHMRASVLIHRIRPDEAEIRILNPNRRKTHGAL